MNEEIFHVPIKKKPGTFNDKCLRYFLTCNDQYSALQMFNNNTCTVHFKMFNDTVLQHVYDTDTVLN